MRLRALRGKPDIVKIKQRPRDFQVEEIVDFPTSAKGPFTLYRLYKERRNTLEAVAAIADRFRVSRADVSYLGLKDYDSQSIQFITVPAGPGRGFKDRGIVLEFAGFAQEPLAKKHFLGNRFEVTVRDLSETGARSLIEGAKLVAAGGMPNFFDDQRFGSARHGRDFPFRKMLDGMHEEALKLLFAAPALQDTYARRARGSKIRKEWGRWGACLRASESPEEKAVFGHLASRPGDFEGAAARMDRAHILLLAYSYQSFIFNETLSRIVRTLSPSGTVMMPYLCGSMAFPRAAGLKALARIENLEIPLPGSGRVDAGPETMKALSSVLHNEKITAEELGRPAVRSVQLKTERRRAVVYPEDLKTWSSRDDGLNPGRRCVRIAMSLPRNSYATIAIKAAAAVGGMPVGPA